MNIETIEQDGVFFSIDYDLLDPNGNPTITEIMVDVNVNEDENEYINIQKE
jgi:hypothetical protein